MTDNATPTPSGPHGPKRQPSVIPGMALLGLAAVLIVIVLVNPDMSSGLKVTIAVLAILVVLALLGFAFKLFLSSQRGGRR